MSTTALDFIVIFTLKSGSEARFEALTNEQVAVTREKDPGVLIYNTSRNENGEYVQFERYRDTQALIDHEQTTQVLLAEWYSLVEVKEITLIGDPDRKLASLDGVPHRKFSRLKGFSR